MQIIALSIVLGLAVLFFIFGIVTRKSHIFFLTTFFFTFFFFILFTLYPLKQLFFGNQGDELFILAQLTQYQNFGFFSDFYYHNLPPFYPPLYFWLAGGLSFWATNAVLAMKVGILFIIIPLWTFGVYYFQKFFWSNASEKSFFATPWFWVTLPLLYFAWIDIPEFLTKPYEILPALFNVIWLGCFAYAVERKKLQNLKTVLLLGITGALSFLTYYFWWFIIIPVMIFIVIREYAKTRTVHPFMYFVCIGIVMFIIATPYIIPLIFSWLGGMENWQARHLVLSDFHLWLPFFQPSVHGLIALIGIIGLYIYSNTPFVRSLWYLFIACYLYQAINYLTFIFLDTTAQPSKPFLFLGGAALCVGAVYGAHGLYNHLRQRYNITELHLKLGLSAIVVILFMPITLFTLDETVRAQLNDAKNPPRGQYLAGIVQKHVPDYKERTWLSSGIPEINAFIPLKYYIAHNAHFSHQSARFENRLNNLNLLISSENSQEFTNTAQSLGIDALLLYKETDDMYPLFFWVDNFPNGGKTLELSLDAKLIDTRWKQVYNDDEWVLYLYNEN